MRGKDIRKYIYLLEIATYVKSQSCESRCNKDFYNLIFAYFWSMYNGNRMVCIYVIVFFPLCKWRQFIPKYNHLLSAVNAFGIYYMFCCNGLRTNFEYYIFCVSLCIITSLISYSFLIKAQSEKKVTCWDGIRFL